jgi:hypothetical protein
MVTQLTKLAAMTQLSNATVGLLGYGPETGPWDSFTIYDDRIGGELTTVNIELAHGAINLTDPADVKIYQDLFPRWLEHAVTGDAALDRLQKISAELRGAM